jgi:hypothetical protein
MQNANLVLTASREGRPKGKEPSGEPESLAGRKLSKMGDRVVRSMPAELEELKKRKPKYVPHSMDACIQYAEPFSGKSSSGAAFGLMH